MARDKIGSFLEVKECEARLNSWIGNYVVSNPGSVGDKTKAEKPLSDAKVEVREVKGKPATMRPSPICVRTSNQSAFDINAACRRGAAEGIVLPARRVS